MKQKKAKKIIYQPTSTYTVRKKNIINHTQPKKKLQKKV